MRVFPLCIALCASLSSACASVDVKGREALRLGPLRDAQMAPASVEPKVVVDAGTDALTDAELAEVEAALPVALGDALAKQANPVGARRVGVARVRGCSLRAGPTEKLTAYVVKCRVAWLVGDVEVAEVTTESYLRVTEVFKRAATKPNAGGSDRNPLVLASDARKALVAALDAAAQLLVNESIATGEDVTGTRATAAATLPRAKRAELARERLARALRPPPPTTEAARPAPSDAATTSRAAGAAPGAAGTTPSEPRTTASELGTTASEPRTTPSEPRTTPSEPGTTPSEPRTTPSDPTTTPAEPNATPQSASNAPSEAGTTSSEHATAPGGAGAHADIVAALFDLRSFGAPVDSALVVPLLAHDDVIVRAAAIDAIGELCDPLLREKLEPLAVPEHAADDVVKRAAKRAVARLGACEAIMNAQ